MHLLDESGRIDLKTKGKHPVGGLNAKRCRQSVFFQKLRQQIKIGRKNTEVSPLVAKHGGVSRLIGENQGFVRVFFNEQACERSSENLKKIKII